MRDIEGPSVLPRLGGKKRVPCPIGIHFRQGLPSWASSLSRFPQAHESDPHFRKPTAETRKGRLWTTGLRPYLEETGGKSAKAPETSLPVLLPETTSGVSVASQQGCVRLCPNESKATGPSPSAPDLWRTGNPLRSPLYGKSHFENLLPGDVCERGSPNQVSN